MLSSKNYALPSNLQALLTELAKIAIEEDLSYSEFGEIARFAFVKAAEQVLCGDKRVTDSRISIVTGMHRKDVKRLRDQAGETFSPEKAKSNRAIAVISAWTREQDYCDEKNKPISLAFDGEAPSLSTLIKEHSGDMPVRAVCDELERMGVIEEKKGRWYLTVPVYVPNKSREAIFNFLGAETTHLLQTFKHNLSNPPRKRRFQRSVAYDELSPESTELFKAFAEERAMDVLKEFDVWLSTREKADKQARKKTPDNERKGELKKAGIGIYYFEETLADRPDGEAS